MNYDWNDLKTREMLEDVFSPTQKRMLELQDKIGALCEMQTDQGIDHRNMYKQMEESLGLGRSTLKQQIMSEIFKTIKGFEQTIKHNHQFTEQRLRELTNEQITFEKKLEVWAGI